MQHKRPSYFNRMCAVLAVLFLILWAASAWSRFELDWYSNPSSHGVRILSWRGQLIVLWCRYSPIGQAPWGALAAQVGTKFYASRSDWSSDFTWADAGKRIFPPIEMKHWPIQWTDGESVFDVKQDGPAVPYWFLVLITGIWPVKSIIRGRRLLPEQCTACRYDLRGSMHSERCPECGQPIPEKQKTQIREILDLQRSDKR